MSRLNEPTNEASAMQKEISDIAEQGGGRATKVEQLIQQYCPDGVEYKPLGEVCDFRNGFAFKSNLFTDEGCPIIRITNISENNVDMSDLKYFHMEDYPKSDLSQFAIKKGDILVAMSGATTGKIGTYKGNITAYLNQRTGKFEPKESLNNRFLYHFLQTQVSNMYKMAGGGAQPNLSSNDLKSKIVIPVPPLPVQEEIVRILDSFTELQAELQAELQKRLQQYNYYRDNLLSFEGRTDVEWKKLGDVATVTKLAGFEFSEYMRYSETGSIIALRGLNVKNGSLDLSDVKYIDKSNFSKLSRSKLYINDMLYTYVGTVGQVALVDENDKYYLAPNVALIRLSDSNILPKFLTYFFLTDGFKRSQVDVLAASSSMKNITMEKIRLFKVPFIPVSEQQKIVDILDRFDKLTTDITAGLPAEIEARRKQYEYYRDQLLTFKQKA